MLALSQEAHRARSVFSCQMAKMKLDFRDLGRETGEKVESISEKKSGTGLQKMTGNIISNIHQGEKETWCTVR